MSGGHAPAGTEEPHSRMSVDNTGQLRAVNATDRPPFQLSTTATWNEWLVCANRYQIGLWERVRNSLNVK